MTTDDYIRLMQGEKLGEMSTMQLYERLSSKLVDAFIAMNYDMQDSRPIKGLALQLAERLRDSYGWLSVDELLFCLNEGLSGNLGSYLRIDIRTVTQWITAYRRSDARYQAVMALQRQAEQRVITPEMNREAGRRMVEKLLRAYAETGKVRTAVPLRVVKEMIEETGLFRYPQDAYERAMRQISRIPAPVIDSKHKGVSMIGEAAEKPLTDSERAFLLLIETAFQKILSKDPSVLLP